MNGCTFGVEEEFMVVGAQGSPLAYNMSSLESALGRPAQLSVEPHIGSIEVATKVCNSLYDLHQNVLSQRNFLREELHKQGGLVIGASTVPWLQFEYVPTLTEGYYHEMVCNYGYAIRGLLIFGHHTHVGGIPEIVFPDVFNQWRYLVPLIIALSANSSWFNGEHTGMQSYRNMRILSMPRSGIPDKISGQDELHQIMDTLVEHGFTTKKSQIWTDFRLHPTYHTLELRMADVQQNDAHAAALSVFMAALTAFIMKVPERLQRESCMPNFLLNENRWLACRDGRDAFFMTPSGKHRIADEIEYWIEQLKPDLVAAGLPNVVQTLREMLHKQPSTLRAMHASEWAIQNVEDV